MILRHNSHMDDRKNEEKLLPQAGVESEGRRGGYLDFKDASASQVDLSTGLLLDKTLTEATSLFINLLT